jgi:hypothetical protein
MSFILTPNEVTSRESVIWIGVIGESVAPTALVLRAGGKEILLDRNWTRFTTRSGRNTLFYQYFTASDLQPGTDYIFELLSRNEVVSICRSKTLPEELPIVGEKPFTVLLASCFSASRPGSGAIGAYYLKLLEKENIALKILCGDQVYLDSPALYFLFNKHSFDDLEEILLDRYVQTWSQGEREASRMSGEVAATAGFRQFLQNGANFFTSDDHEFWNNAPDAATLIRDSWSPAGRYNWMKIARALLEIFQSNRSHTIFSVGRLSFFIADTRVNRDANRMSFMSAGDLAALAGWVRNLKGAGVLVVGQPIFSQKAGYLKGTFGDWNLPDYAQYTDFARILNDTEHSIAVLTGDVHYGRIARCQLKPGIEIYEIISSPTSLVDARVGGKWQKAPDKFPSFGIPGIAQKTVVNNFDYQFTANHFLLLNFYRDAGKTKVVLKVCKIAAGGAFSAPAKIAEFHLS